MLPTAYIQSFNKYSKTVGHVLSPTRAGEFRMEGSLEQSEIYTNLNPQNVGWSNLSSSSSIGESAYAFYALYAFYGLLEFVRDNEPELDQSKFYIHTAICRFLHLIQILRYLDLKDIQILRYLDLKDIQIRYLDLKDVEKELSSLAVFSESHRVHTSVH
jgi:hypothetical protein